ncbi:hypothetical protein [Plantactinospora sp. B24E8]|uniref:hypothetical protein n=1 Tax=Plantactinospora sp. B24E8 TaxID=3153567 RepID=UPI00325CA490
MLRRHRRYWRRLWLYCWCGFRWKCPDAVPTVPMPFDPDPNTPGPAVPVWSPTTAPMPAVVLPHVTPDAPPPLAQPRAVNQGPGWNGPTGFGHRAGRPGRLTPAQESRTSARP